MGRRPITHDEREHGRQLGRIIADERERATLSAPQLAQASTVGIDTLRSLEGGRVATPAFLTIARLAEALALSLDEIQAEATRPMPGAPDTAQSAP